MIEQKFCTHDAVQEEHAKDAELSISFLECGRDEPVEEGGHLLELFQLEQGVARSVLEQHEVGRHVSVIYYEIKLEEFNVFIFIIFYK